MEKSRDELHRLISDLTRQMKETVYETLCADCPAFLRRRFRELFGGGTAKLQLTDADHVLESGIDISVQPPGKIVSHLESLSGGEKALVGDFPCIFALFENVTLVKATSEAEIFQQMIHIDERDLIVGLSFPRYSHKATKAMQFAHNSGAKVVAITDSAASPLAEFADYTLLARSDIAAIADTLVAPLSLIDALIVTVAMKMEKTIGKTFGRLEQIWDEYHVYETINPHEETPHAAR